MAALRVMQMAKESWSISKSGKDVCCLRPNPFRDSQTPVVVACRQETQQKKDNWLLDRLKLQKKL